MVDGQWSMSGLTMAQLAPIVEEAKARWIASGLTTEQAAALASLHFTIADLGGATLGLTDGTSVLIDRTAAGYGWFIDPTPFTNEEFVNGGSMVEGRWSIGSDSSRLAVHDSRLPARRLGNALPRPTARPRARWISSPRLCTNWGTCWATTITPSIHP